MAVDAIERAGLEVAYLREEKGKALYEILPDAATIFNPIDLLADADAARYEAALQAAFADDGVDAIILIMVSRGTSLPLEIAETIIKHCPNSKPLFVSFIGGAEAQKAKNLFRSRGVPEYDSPERAVAALKAMCDYVKWTRRAPRIVTRFRVHRRKVERIIYRSLRANRLYIGEVKAKDILNAYDFQIPEGYLATSPEEAVEIAERIGYPVAMKIVSSDIDHKTDLGGVRLNISNRMGVLDSYELMLLRIRRNFPAAVIEGIYLEKMLDRGLEVIIGMNRDTQFGPMLMFGLGGIFVEVMEDVAFHLAPITFDEAIQMLTGTRSYEILVGARGKDKVDIKSIAQSLQRISQLVTDFPQIAELDINPLIIGEFGTEPFVANAHISLRQI
jgi:acetyltransferase